MKLFIKKTWAILFWFMVILVQNIVDNGNGTITTSLLTGIILSYCIEYQTRCQTSVLQITLVWDYISMEVAQAILPVSPQND